jgi:hypothetical protein
MEGTTEPGGEEAQPPKKIAVSYARTPERHKVWVMEFASRLKTDGVEVVIDDWKLKPGDDVNVFMEKFVNDETIDHVLIICNKDYTEKADRRGEKPSGVGTESTVISAKLYREAQQNKFIPVIAENNENGTPLVPTYLDGRYYVNLSNDDVFEEEYEKLMKLIHGKELHPEPPLGRLPSYITEDEDTGSSTRHRYLRARRLLDSDQRKARGAIRDYLDDLIEAVEAMRARTTTSGPPSDDALVEAIDESKPYRDEFVQLTSLLARSWDASTPWPISAKFFERLLERCTTRERHSEAEFEPVQFFVYELFLCYAAILAEEDQFVPLQDLVLEPFIDPLHESNGPWARGFSAMSFRLVQVDARRAQQLKRISPVADMLKERCDPHGPSFEALQQTDFLLYLSAKSRWEPWIARTLALCDTWFPRPIRAFLQIDSPRYKRLLGIFLDGTNDREGAIEFFEKHFQDPRGQRVWASDTHLGVPIVPLMNLHGFDPKKFPVG